MAVSAAVPALNRVHGKLAARRSDTQGACCRTRFVPPDWYGHTNAKADTGQPDHDRLKPIRTISSQQ